jgi:hypothetical protein
MDKIKRIWGIIKENPRQIWAFLVLAVFFGLSSSFPADKITSESCAGGACEQLVKDPTLSDANLKYFQNDVFASNAGEFYRLTFREKSNQDTKISLKVTDVLDREKPLKSFELKKSEQDNFQEVLFGTDKKYTDFLFEKEADGAEVVLTDLRITKLNVKNEAELAKIIPTIFGEADVNVVSQAQTENNFVFKQLEEPKVILGQVFRAEKDFITEIEVDFNVIKQGQGGGGNFEFVLKKANFEFSVPEIKSDSLASVKFSPAEAERFRQSNGKFKFPVYKKVTSGEYYFFGINNDRSDGNQFNFLELRGSSDADIYPNGSVAVKKSGETFSALGNLCFKIFGIEWKEYAGKKILLGETLEDVSGGKIIFKYQAPEKQIAVADLETFTGTVSFDEKNKTIVGLVDAKNNSSSFSYKFETPFPFKNLKIFAEKKNPDWLRTKLSYSLDGQKWTSLVENPDAEMGGQEFNQIIPNIFGKNVVYFKIEPEVGGDTLQDKDEWKYGVENLRVEGELRS